MTTPADPDPAPGDPGAPWKRAFGWIEENLGGRIVRWERQPRWRPAFFLELERGAERLSLYFRGARPELENGPAALRHEAKVLRRLEEADIPVPHVYGLCPEPPGIVMERSAGRANLATARDEAERRSVLYDYVEILARMHALDVAPFEKDGLARPRSARELGLCDLPSWEGRYRKTKRRPEPLLEFVLRWLHRNVPEGRSRVSFLAADSGQFLFEDERVTALLDLELACLGDPAADLAGMRGRDLSEPLGDLGPAFARYCALTGEAIPSSVIDYHTVRFNLYTPLALSPLVAHPPPGIDLVQYLGWYWVWARSCLEVIADGTGLELSPIALPDPTLSRHSRAHDALVGRLEQAASRPGGERDFAAYEMDAAYRTAVYLQRGERYGGALEAEERAEVRALLGRDAAVDRWEDRDAALEAFVSSAGPEHDPELIRLLHRRSLRQEALLQPVLRELEGVSIQRLRSAKDA